MTDEQFEALVGRLEAEAKRNPAGYGTRVLLMALFGYAYLGAMLLLIARTPPSAANSAGCAARASSRSKGRKK